MRQKTMYTTNYGIREMKSQHNKSDVLHFLTASTNTQDIST